MRMFGALWNYRGFILESVKRDFQSQYTNALLGAVWTIIRPLAMIVVYTIIFAQVMQAKLPGLGNAFSYSIYLCAGVLTWGFFTETLTKTQNVFLEHANLLKKISFPRFCLPVIVVINAGVNFLIIFGLFTLFLILSGNFPGVVFIALLPLLLVQVAFSVGLGITLGVLNVFFRDIGQFFVVVLQFWFWLTPVVYPIGILPVAVRPIVENNPMTALIGSYQRIFVEAQWPVWETLWPITLLSVVLCGIGLRLFRQHAGEMVDEL